MSNRVILIECNPDETLMQECGIFRRRIEHSYGKSRIGNKLNKNKNYIALIDEDPDGTQPPYFKKTNFSIVKKEFGYTIKSDKNNNHTIVELEPNLETWILDACKEISVDIRTYNLPNNARSLHNIINININKFRELVKNLLQYNCRLLNLRDEIHKL